MIFNPNNFAGPEKIKQFSKIKLLPNDIALKYVMTNNRGALSFTYLVVIFKENPTSPSIPLQYNQVDLLSLKEAILSKFKIEDKIYIEIISFDISKVIIKFKHDEWIKDAFKNTAGVPRFSKFEIEFKLKKQVPMFILYDGFMAMFNEFIQPKMIEYVKKNNLGKSYFIKLADSQLKKRVEKYFGNMFDYVYNYQQNTFSIKLKGTFVLLFAYGASKIVDDKMFLGANDKNFEDIVKKTLFLNKIR